MNLKTLWLGLLGFCLLAATTMIIVVAMTRAKPVVVGSSAQAWMWTAPEMQSQLLSQMEQYSKKANLTFESRTIPASWNMISITVTTPKGNEMEIINATAPDKYSVSITVFHKDENWRKNWEDLRAYLNAHYKWEDIP